MNKKLNCWPGCNAMVVRSACGNEGNVVKVLRRAEIGELIVSECGQMELEIATGTTWVISQPLRWGGTTGCEQYMLRAAKDQMLFPLRDDDGQDEMLRTAGLPNKETTLAAH